MGWLNDLGYAAKSSGIVNVMVDVDLDQLRSAARQIREAHREYCAQHRRIVSIIDNLNVSWKGKDTSEYVKQVKGFEPQLGKLEALINEYAAFLESCATEYGKTDEEVAAEFMKIGR